jgi:hypothetical protein
MSGGGNGARRQRRAPGQRHRELERESPRRLNVDAGTGHSSLSSNGDERNSTADVAIIVRDQMTITIRRRGLSVVRRGLSGIKRGWAGVKRGRVFVLERTRRGGAGFKL